MTKIRWSLLFAAALTGCVFADEAGINYAEDTLSGDWGGGRTRWAGAGVNVEMGLKADIFRNRGALSAGDQTMWQLDARIRGDLEKIFGWKGMSAYTQIIDNHGGRTNSRHVGSFMGVSNLEVDQESTRFFHAWVQKEAFDGQLFALVGLYPIDSEFQVIDSAGMFSHPAYGPTAELSLTRGPSIFPVSAFGVRLRGQSTDGATYVQAALLDGVPGDPNHQKGTHIQFNEGDGSFGIIELGAKSVAAKDSTAAPPASKLAIGAWGYTARVPDLIDVDADGSPINRSSRGAYILAERELWRIGGDSARGVTGFFRYSGTDGDSTEISRALNIGLRFNGLVPGRAEDAIGIAYTRSSMGTKFRQVQEAGGINAATYEDALEIGYRAQVNKWLVVQPLAQRIRNPGADQSVPHSTIFGVRVEMAL